MVGLCSVSIMPLWSITIICMGCCVMDKMNIGGGRELKDGYYVPYTVAGCGKETKG